VSAVLGIERCIVVVIDLQNDFCHENGGMARLGLDVSRAQAMMDNVRALLDRARAGGVPVIFMRTTHSEWFDTPAWVSRGRGGDVLDVDRIPLVQEGTWGAEFYGVQPGPDDLVLTKHRFSAFAYTPLELSLRARNKDTVVLAGTVTNVCVEATAVDALMRGFFPVLVSDCSAARSAAADDAARAEFEDHVGTVVTLRELQVAWGVHEPTTATSPA
jgi:ureidoacrylate peracid hydrolase